MSEMTGLQQLEQCCGALELALADNDCEAMIRLDREMQEGVSRVKTEGVAADRQLIARLQAIYPVMIEACSQQRSQLAAKLKALRASKTPLQALKRWPPLWSGAPDGFFL